MQRIQYAKTKSDVIAKADGTFVPREKRKRHDEKGGISLYVCEIVSPILSIFVKLMFAYLCGFYF